MALHVDLSVVLVGQAGAGVRFDQVGSFVMRPLGLALTGPVAEAVGERRWLLVTAGVMTVATLLALKPRPVRTLERRSTVHPSVPRTAV